MLAPTRSRNAELAIAIARDGRPKYLLAALAGVPANVYSGFISGRVAPTAAQRERVAAVLGTTVAELFG